MTKRTASPTSLIPALTALFPLPCVYLLLGLHDLLRYGRARVDPGVFQMFVVALGILFILGLMFCSASIRRILGSRFAWRFCFALLPVVLLLALVEGFSGVYLRMRFPPSGLFSTDRLRSAVYHDVDWAPRIIELGEGLTYDYVPMRLWKTAPVTDPLMNVSDQGRRATVSLPSPTADAPEFRVQIYGGSTVFCSEVPDSMTLPSYVARELALRMPDHHVIVENCGDSGYVRTQQVSYLIQNLQNGSRPNYVIFYDGANDLIYPLWEGIPHMHQDAFISAIKGEQLSLPILAAKTFGFATNLGKLVERMRKLPGPPAIRPSDSELQMRAGVHATRYLAEAETVRQLCAAQGIRTAFFLQPMLYQKLEPAGREKMFMHYENANRPGIGALYSMFAQELKAREAATGHSDFHDLSLLFSDRKDELYLDIVHVGPRSNEEIGRAIAEAVVEAHP